MSTAIDRTYEAPVDNCLRQQGFAVRDRVVVDGRACPIRTDIAGGTSFQSDVALGLDGKLRCDTIECTNCRVSTQTQS